MVFKDFFQATGKVNKTQYDISTFFIIIIWLLGMLSTIYKDKENKNPLLILCNNEWHRKTLFIGGHQSSQHIDWFIILL